VSKVLLTKGRGAQIKHELGNKTGTSLIHPPAGPSCPATVIKRRRTDELGGDENRKKDGRAVVPGSR